MTGRSIARGAGVLAAYAALAVAFTWPLAARLSSAVPHDLGDPLGFMWIFWWNAQTVPLTPEWLNAPIFYPATGAIVFQDSFVGVWPITTPLQWLTASPLVAHNVLIIASFALSAFTAYLFCRRLFGDRGAAFAGGLTYGFAIFRLCQIPHLNVLLTFWIPLIFLCLHRYLDDRRWRWLCAAAACWAVQATTSGYFLAFSTVLIGLWTLFFFRASLRDYFKLLIAFGAGLLAIWPWLQIYRTVHTAYGFRRGIAEADWFGADVMGLFRAPPYLTVWGRWLGYDGSEGQFFPGLVLALAVAAVVVTSRYWQRPRVSTAVVVLIGVAALSAAAAAAAHFAPGTYQVAGLRVSLTRPFKPLSWTWIALIAAIAISPPMRRMVRDRSVAGFYAVAALVLWLLALGPTVRFMGYRVWYKAPYSWLYMVPGAESVRVPARMWMLVMLALGVIVAYGLVKLRQRSPRASSVATAVVCVALVLEAWPGGMPYPALPDRIAELEAPSTGGVIPVLELPADAPGRNLAAMYRAIYHRRPLINGYSGYEPSWFPPLVAATTAGDADALAPFAELTAFDILVHADAGNAADLIALAERAGAARVASTDRWTLFRMPRRPATEAPAVSAAAAIARAVHPKRGDITALMTDDNPESIVEADVLDVSLTTPCRVDEVQIGGGGLARITVTTADDPLELWSGTVAERAVRAALADPRQPLMRLRFAPTRLTGLRIRPEPQPGVPYSAIDTVRVFGPDCAGPGRL